jgi:6-phosphogluconolactonase
MDINGMKINKPDYLPEHINWHGANSAEQLSEELNQTIGQLLSQALSQDQRASLAVSGGRTPIALFEKLSTFELDWSKIDLSLVDERWVPSISDDSNEHLVRTHLLVNYASKANFIPMKNEAKTAFDGLAECEKSLQNIKQPFDVVVLGMGNDGHTASLFPCSEELTLAMDPDYQHTCIATTPTSAPYQRMSLSRNAISRANNIILHITGEDKLSTFELAMNNKDASQMPIYAFLTQPMSIYWCS